MSAYTIKECVTKTSKANVKYVRSYRRNIVKPNKTIRKLKLIYFLSNQYFYFFSLIIHFFYFLGWKLEIIIFWRKLRSGSLPPHEKYILDALRRNTCTENNITCIFKKKFEKSLQIRNNKRWKFRFSRIIFSFPKKSLKNIDFSSI